MLTYVRFRRIRIVQGKKRVSIRGCWSKWHIAQWNDVLGNGALNGGPLWRFHSYCRRISFYHDPFPIENNYNGFEIQIRLGPEMAIQGLCKGCMKKFEKERIR